MKIPECSEISPEDIGEWIVCDSSNPLFQILDDEELIESVREESVEEEDDLLLSPRSWSKQEIIS